VPPHPTLKSHLRTLRRSTRVIARTLNKLEGRLRRLQRQAERAAGRGKRTIRITAKRRAQLKLQGAYMGFMRQLKPAQKAKVKALKAKRGFEAAIRAAKRLAAA